MNRSNSFDARRARHLDWRSIAIVATTLLGATNSPTHGGTLVQMDFGTYGSVHVDLLDSVAPTSAANFLQYVNANRYDGSMIHRSSPQSSGFGLIQGGGYYSDATPVPQFAPIVLEYHLANARGTLGYARLSSSLDSATSQWFFNTTDNSVALSPPNGGGYAVFGWVVGTGMTTIDDINALPTFPYNSPFNQIPLDNFTMDDFNNAVDPTTHTVELQDVSIVATHPSFQNPIDPWDVDNDGFATPSDLVLIQDHLATFGSHVMDASYVGDNYLYLDTNGDGLVSQLDLVPEPSSAALAVLGIVGILIAGSRRWGKRA